MMRSLRLLVAVLIVTYTVATENEDENKGKCRELNVPELGSLAYTNANRAEGPLSEPFPNCTVATLSCSDDRRIVGNSGTQCLDGEWKEQLGHCARECKRIHDARHHSVSYSKAEGTGGLPDGTSATLTCNPGPAVGRTESSCDDGKWTHKLGYCGSSCSQRAVEELGYSGVHVNGKREDGNVTHGTDVELLCGEERHEYRCFDGAFRSKHPYWPCGTAEDHKKRLERLYYVLPKKIKRIFFVLGICSTAKAARLGYTAVNIRGKSAAGHPVEGTLVGLLCRNEWHYYSCRDGCAPPNSTTTEYARPTFSASAKDGTYESGTLVNLFCETGPVIDGPSKSRCFGGDWYPPLGRCPPKCDPVQVSRGVSVSYTNKYAPKSMVTKGIYSNGTVAQLTCTDGRRIAGKDSTQCRNGKWTPKHGHCAVGCWPLHETKRKDSLKYSTSESKGQYPDGTNVTLSCTRGRAVGRNVSKCGDGIWTPTLGHCDTNCKFGKAERDLGFSGTYPIDVSTVQDGIRTYFKCKEGKTNAFYLFKCVHGEWHPEKNSPKTCGKKLRATLRRR